MIRFQACSVYVVSLNHKLTSLSDMIRINSFDLITVMNKSTLVI